MPISVAIAARRIGTLSYEETQELAESGAKVLNAQAVEFAKDKGIAIYARATKGPLPGPDPSADGTVVRKHPPRMPGTVVGVASEKDVIVLSMALGASAESAGFERDYGHGFCQRRQNSDVQCSNNLRSIGTKSEKMGSLAHPKIVSKGAQAAFF